MRWNALLLLFYIYEVTADCYLHNPSGSNGRLDGQNRDRQTANRICDTQNNARGGYNVGGSKDRSQIINQIFGRFLGKRIPGIRAKAEEEYGPPGKMKYYVGSKLSISWTNQHSCGGENNHCEVIIQYMCDKNLRDGSIDSRIPNPNQCATSEDGKSKNCDTDRRFGMHEDTTYYTKCKNRKRNKGLFTADQNLKGETSIYTRQNANGNRNGYECAEERDYYPYWKPTPWIDIAVMTNNVSRCDYYKNQSENVKPRWYCKISDKTIARLLKNNGNGGANDRIPITKDECEQATFDGEKGKWVKDTRKPHPPPACIFSPKSRDNHNGNGPNGFNNMYNWTLPNIPHKHCAIRIRYNISTADFNRTADSNSNANGNNKATTLDIGAVIGADSAEAKSRGFVFKGNPTVQPLKIVGIDGTTNIGEKLNLALAINTAQFARTFQDRTHSFSIEKRPSHLEGVHIHNLNVQGKRGNQQQVYPASEYDYCPNRLEVKKDHYVHIQWTGSDRNPANNAGNGKAQTDRSNMLLLKGQNYPEGDPGVAISAGLKNGHWGNNYPTSLDNVNKTLLGLDKDKRQYLALTVNTTTTTLRLGSNATRPLPPPSSDHIQTCPKEDGFCVRQDGGDQNSGVFKLDSLNQKSALQQADCLRRCQQRSDATGCEVIWDQGNRGCYVHTKEVARGNGVRRHFCWVLSKCNEVKGFKLDLIKNEEPITRNKLLKTITLLKNFVISFDILPTQYQNTWQNVMHMTIGGNSHKYGTRTPALWFWPGRGSTRKLVICGAVNGIGRYGYCYTSKKSYPLNKWISIKVVQTGSNNNYQYSVYLDGVKERTIKNNRPQVFNGVKIYEADPWHKSLIGKIRNFQVISGIPEDPAKSAAPTKATVTVDANKYIQLTKNNLIANLTLHKRYDVTFDVMPTQWQNKWQNVLHMTIGPDAHIYGSRTPGLWFYPGTSTSRKMAICGAVNGKAGWGFCHTTRKSYPLNAWVKIKVQQVKKGNRYEYSVHVDGTRVRVATNRKAVVWPKVKVYAADPWSNAQTGWIRNLVINSYPSTEGLAQLDEAHPYFNLEPQIMTAPGEYKFMSTRNNAFTNRSQKGKITVKEGDGEATAEDTTSEMEYDEIKDNIETIDQFISLNDSPNDGESSKVVIAPDTAMDGDTAKDTEAVASEGEANTLTNQSEGSKLKDGAKRELREVPIAPKESDEITIEQILMDTI